MVEEGAARQRKGRRGELFSHCDSDGYFCVGGGFFLPPTAIVYVAFWHCTVKIVPTCSIWSELYLLFSMLVLLLDAVGV